MTIEEAQAELTKLRGYAETGSLASHEGEVDALYWEVCRKRVRKCNCKDRFNDALIEIYRKINQLTIKQSSNMAVHGKATLVRGVLIYHNGIHYTNDNLTDEVARAFLAQFPQREDWFEVLPDVADAEEVEKPIEHAPQVAPKEVAAASQPKTPSKKKSAKKRK